MLDKTALMSSAAPLASSSTFDALGSGPGGPLAIPTPWIQHVGWINYPGGVVIGTPTLGQQGNGSLNLQSLFLNGVIVNLALYLQLTGGTMTGPLILSGTPTQAFQAATKQYIDNMIAATNNNFANYLPLAGGTLNGNLTMGGTATLTLSGDPTVAAQAATKNYVDVRTSGIIAIPDAPSDGTSYMRNNAAWTGTIDAGTF